MGRRPVEEGRGDRRGPERYYDERDRRELRDRERDRDRDFDRRTPPSHRVHDRRSPSGPHGPHGPERYPPSRQHLADRERWLAEKERMARMERRRMEEERSRERNGMRREERRRLSGSPRRRRTGSPRRARRRSSPRKRRRSPGWDPSDRDLERKIYGRGGGIRMLIFYWTGTRKKVLVAAFQA